MPPLSRETVSGMIVEALIDRDSRISELEAMVSTFNSENSELRKDISQLKHDMNQTKLHLDHLERVSDDHNQYSRKLNLILDGFRVSKSDDNSTIRGYVISEIRRMKLDIEDREVDRAHRIEHTYQDRNGRLHVPVICRFTNWNARNIFYEARKESNVFVKADLTLRRQDLLNDAKHKMAVTDSREASFLEYVFVDRNCHLTMKTKDGRYLKFNSMVEFDRQVDYVEDTRPPDLSAWKCHQKYYEKLYEPAIVNLNRVQDVKEWLDDEDHAYVGRDHGNIEGSKWGNPFRIPEHDINTSLILYEEYITSNPDLFGDLGSLKKKSLGCWCFDPEKCHANILLKLIGT